MFVLPSFVLKPFQKNASQKYILIFLAVQVIEMVGILWLYYFHRNVALLSAALPASDQLWGLQRWRFLFLLGLFGLFVTCVGLAGAWTRRHTIMIPFFCLAPVRSLLVGILVQPPLSMACACYHTSYAQCAALHSFEDKERKFDSHAANPFEPEVPEEFIATMDFPEAVPYSEAQSFIEKVSVTETARGYRKTMPKRALGHAVLQADVQEVADGAKLEPPASLIAQSDSIPQYGPPTLSDSIPRYGPHQQPLPAAQGAWVHPQPYGQNGYQAPGSNYAVQQPYGPSWTPSITSPQIPKTVQQGSDFNRTACAELLASIRSSSLLEAPSQTQSADDAKRKPLDLQQQMMNQLLNRRIQHVADLKKMVASTEADLCRDLQFTERAQAGNLEALTKDFKAERKDAARAKLRGLPGGVPQPHVDDLKDAERVKLKTKVYLDDACRCEYPSCYQTDDSGKEHWCYIEQRTMPDCIAKNLTLSKDPNNDKVWTKDLCKAPCHCMGSGLKPPSVLIASVPQAHQDTVTENPYFYGSQCEKWDAGDGVSVGDRFEWCYVGLDSTCTWRDKSLAPFDLHPKWYYRSHQACKSKDMDVSDSCKMWKFYFLFIGMVDFVCFWVLMLLLYYFIGNQCGDFIKADADFVANTTDSEDEDADADNGDKAGAAKEAKNAEESNSEEEDGDARREDSARQPRKHQAWED